MPDPQSRLESWEVLDLLTSLVQKSLVLYEEDEEGRGRYRLLETVRRYARDRLLARGAEGALWGPGPRGEAAAVRERHRDWFLALAEEAEQGLGRASETAWLERLEREHDNLRAALEWSGAQGQSEAGLRLGGALVRFWEVRGYWTEGREHLAGLLALPAAEARPIARAGALRGAGALAMRQGDWGEARALYEESLAISRELGNKPGIDQTLHDLGNLARKQADLGGARALLEASLAVSRELGDKRGIAWSLTGLGWGAHARGDGASARALFGESLAIGREAGNKPRIVEDLEGLAAVAVAQGQPERAARLFGAAEGLREAISAPLPPADRAEHDRSVAAAHTALGAEAFAAAWAEGRALSLDQAVQYALAEGSDA